MILSTMLLCTFGISQSENLCFANNNRTRKVLLHGIFYDDIGFSRNKQVKAEEVAVYAKVSRPNPPKKVRKHDLSFHVSS